MEDYLLSQVPFASHWHTFIFFHLSHISFSSVFTLKTKAFTLQTSAPPFYQNPKKLFDLIPSQPYQHTHHTQMWKEIKNYLLPVQNWTHSCSASPTHSPLNLFPRFPLTSSQWYLATDTASRSLSCLQHGRLFFSLSPPMYLSIYLTLCALLSLNSPWRDREALPTFILHGSTPILR